MLTCSELDKNCCFRVEYDRCGILADVTFRDGMCHFRKETIYGVNKYDEWRRKNSRKAKENPD